LPLDQYFHQAVVEQAPDAVMVTLAGASPTELAIVYVNAAFARLTGYSWQEVVGKTPRLLQKAETACSLTDSLLESVRSGRPSVGRTLNYRRSGEEFLMEASIAPLRDASGNITHLVTVLRDVTEQWRVEEALRQNERLLQHISDTLPAVLFIYDLDAHRLRYVSRESLTIVGYLSQELTGGEVDLLEMLHPDDLSRVAEVMGELNVATESAMAEVECRVKHRTGEWRWLWLRATAFDHFPNGTARQLLGVALDVTESRRLHEQLNQSSRLESLGRLAGGVAHDFNNLLTIIQSYAELVQETLSDEHAARAYVQHIARAAEQASNLTSQMLAFARRRIISPQVIDLNELVRETEALLQHLLPENITLQTVLKPDLWRVSADPTQIEQVILNLAINARDAMPDGGMLTIETANVMLDESYAARHAEVQTGEYVLLVVSDTGIGMDERTLGHLFEPFFTTKEVGKGTGLGLSTCYGIVKQAGGSIWVYSEPGKGTTFKVYLPRTHDLPVAPPEQTKEKTLRGGEETVLIVEDNDAVREVAVLALQKRGYRVLQAASGEEALALAEQLQEPIHLLLTDVVMPGMSGAVLAVRMRERYPNLKVLYSSGYTENVIMHHGVLEENIAFLSKPYRPAELVQRVREVLDAE
jgi:PAS domain S-box-containing protein